jgi:hypothetical protein
MKLPASHTSLPTHDYSLALQHAVSWLGDRYLLAAPINVGHRIGHMRAPRTPWLYLVEQQSQSLRPRPPAPEQLVQRAWQSGEP